MLGNVLFVVAPAKSAQLADDLLGPLVICTSHGPQVLDPGGDIPEPGDASSSHCPGCTLVKSFALALAPLPPEFLPPPQSGPSIGWSPTLPAVSRLKLGGIGSRAPPAFA